MRARTLFAGFFALAAVLLLCLVLTPSASATAPIARYEVRNDLRLSDSGVEEMDEGTTLFLDASDSEDPDGGPIAKYEWFLLDDTTDEELIYSFSEGEDKRPTATFSDTDLPVGTYEIVLRVTDDDGEVSSTAKVLSVVEAEEGSASPWLFFTSVVVIAVLIVLFPLLTQQFSLGRGGGGTGSGSGKKKGKSRKRRKR